MTIQYALIEAFRDTQLQMRENPALKSATLAMQAATRLYLNDFSAIDPCLKSTAPHISVLADTSLHCAQGQITPSKRVTVLNFANAYHPGGGVKKGAAAQEECLCRSSNLYAALTLPYMLKHYYKWNEKNTGDMGSDRIIYSPGVTVFKSDDIIPENLDPFFRKMVIQLTGILAVQRISAHGIGFLVADKHIVGFFFIYDFKELLGNSFYFTSSFLIQNSRLRICVFDRRQIIFIVQNGYTVDTIAGRHFFFPVGIHHISHTIAAQRSAPMCLRLHRIHIHDLLIIVKCLVKVLALPCIVCLGI